MRDLSKARTVHKDHVAVRATPKHCAIVTLLISFVFRRFCRWIIHRRAERLFRARTTGLCVFLDTRNFDRELVSVVCQSARCRLMACMIVVYHTQRMQRVFAVQFTGDAQVGFSTFPNFQNFAHTCIAVRVVWFRRRQCTRMEVASGCAAAYCRRS